MNNPSPLQPIILPSQGGRALWHLGALLNFKALTSETGGQYWALEGLADSHMAVPLHAHTQEDEVWFVLEGEIEFTIGEEIAYQRPRHLRLHPPKRTAYLPGKIQDCPLVWFWAIRQSRPMVL